MLIVWAPSKGLEELWRVSILFKSPRGKGSEQGLIRRKAELALTT